jgi:hypothetical protein
MPVPGMNGRRYPNATCAAANELSGQNFATAELAAQHFIDNRFQPKECELSAAAESCTTGLRRTALYLNAPRANGDNNSAPLFYRR